MAGPKNKQKLRKGMMTYGGKRMHSSTAEGLAMEQNVSHGEGTAGGFRDYVYEKGHGDGHDLSEAQINKLYKQYIEEKNRKFMN
tara:strand:+ start:2193 stop:2444 length:252 start_codon:yes stop_codon:yes gene_type:complete